MENLIKSKSRYVYFFYFLLFSFHSLFCLEEALRKELEKEEEELKKEEEKQKKSRKRRKKGKDADSEHKEKLETIRCGDMTFKSYSYLLDTGLKEKQEKISKKMLEIWKVY